VPSDAKAFAGTVPISWDAETYVVAIVPASTESEDPGTKFEPLTVTCVSVLPVATTPGSIEVIAGIRLLIEN
jgi:hypothetical protein